MFCRPQKLDYLPLAVHAFTMWLRQEVTRCERRGAGALHLISQAILLTSFVPQVSRVSFAGPTPTMKMVFIMQL